MGLDDEHYMRMAQFDKVKELRRKRNVSVVERTGIAPWIFGIFALAVILTIWK